MPGLEGDLEEWQTQEVNVTQGEAHGDTNLKGLPLRRHPRAQTLYVLLFLTDLLFHAHINIHYFSLLTKGTHDKVFVGDNTTRSITISLY